MKKYPLLLLLMLPLFSAKAQETTFWQKINYLLTKPAVVDTMRIYQPDASFSLGLISTGQKAGFDVNAHFMMDWDENGSLNGLSQYGLTEDLCKKVGLEAGYGNVALGYSLEVGPRSAWKKSALGLGYVGRAWGLRFNYFKITNPFVSSLTFGQEGDADYEHYEITADDPALLQNLNIDGYYVFNNKRFAFPAAYKMSLVQRHTAGSWMVTARYMQGSLYNSPDGALSSYNLIDCFSTMQASVGGGYSVNFVPWHRDPKDTRDHGLRNLTINLTAMPVITFFNYLKFSNYQYGYNEETGSIEATGETVSKVLCYPMPNYIGSAASSLTLGRWYFSAQFSYNHFYFHSRLAFDQSQLDLPNYVDDLRFDGAFHDWTLKGLLVYRL